MAGTTDTSRQASAAGRWTLLVTVLGSSLPIIDVTAMNVVAPAIQADLDTTVLSLQWILSAYTLIFASLMLVGGALGDRYGRARLFGIGSMIFAAGSLACGAAPDAKTLIAARAFQGLGAALLVPGSLSLLGATFDGAERARAIGIWSGASALMAVIGPIFGGIVSDIGSWRWIFLVNVPIALLLLLPLYMRVPESKDPETGPLDITGAMLATVGLGLIAFAVIESGVHGWQTFQTAGGAVGGALLLALFIGHEGTAKHPMMPLRLFRHRAFTLANAYTFCVYFALAAGMFFLPMRLLLFDGYTPTQAGLAVMPVALFVGLLSPRVGAWATRLGSRPFIVGGGIIVAIGWALLARVGTEPVGLAADTATFWITYAKTHAPGVLFVGAGMGLVAAPLSTTILGSVPTRHVGLASGINNAISRTAALLAIATSGAIALAVYSHWLAASLPELGLGAAQEAAAWAARVDLGAAQTPPSITGSAATALAHAYDEAFVAAYRWVQITMATMTALGAMAALGLPNDTGTEQRLAPIGEAP